jgi:hypothetical protein
MCSYLSSESKESVRWARVASQNYYTLIRFWRGIWRLFRKTLFKMEFFWGDFRISREDSAKSCKKHRFFARTHARMRARAALLNKELLSDGNPAGRGLAVSGATVQTPQHAKCDLTKQLWAVCVFCAKIWCKNLKKQNIVSKYANLESDI